MALASQQEYSLFYHRRLATRFYSFPFLNSMGQQLHTKHLWGSRSNFLFSVIRTRFFGAEYRGILPCVSSKKRPHDIVGAPHEAKIEGSGGKGGGH